jgi:hypothetical protein
VAQGSWALCFKNRWRFSFAELHPDLVWPGDGSGTTRGAQATQATYVGEAQWNYERRSWTITRWREKDPNAWDTVDRTLENIWENVTLSEVHESMT